MAIVTTQDGVEIFYKDWGPSDAQPIVFHHGWPLSADDWDAQLLYFLSRGYRVIAHDRRGHGRSSQVSDGHDMDHYAADTSAVVEHLDLWNAVHIGHSTGGGQATRYVARYGEPQGRVARLVLMDAVTPLVVRTPSNPGGLPIEVLDGLRQQLAANRSRFYWDLAAGPFYGFNRPGATPLQPVIMNWWRQGMMGSAKAHYDGIKAFSETDFTEDLKAITVPTLVIHGDDDQIVPIADSAPLAAKLLKNGSLKIYKGFPHGLLTTHAEVVNPDLLAFVKAGERELGAASARRKGAGPAKTMKVVVVGGTGLIGSKVTARLRAAGHEALAAAPQTGVNTITGAGLDAVLEDADVVVDLVNSPSFDAAAAMSFFMAHERNLLAAEARAGVSHHVALSIVGDDRSPDNGYFRAKVAQEDLIKESGIPYTIVRSTQFMESLGAIVDAGQADGAVAIATGLFQPIAADDVAAFVAEAATSPPRNGTIEIAGPEKAPFDEVVRSYLEMTGDMRLVRSDPQALYYGGRVERSSLVPLGEARLGATTLTHWAEERRMARVSS